jgi:hypothetical protein
LSTRSALLVITAAVLIAACGASAPLTPAPAVHPTSVPAQPDPSAAPEGDVEGVQAGRPELAIEAVDGQTLLVTVGDATAKGWRITIAGRDAADRLELVVESSDIAPGVHVDEIVGDQVVATDDLTRMPDEPTVAAGGCHRSLAICWSSDGIDIDEAQGVVAARFHFENPSAAFAITGSTATWPAEPFILGDWHDSEVFRSWQ